MTRTSRRDFLVHGAAMAFGGRLLAASPRQDRRALSIEPRVDAVIQIHMAGGLSHIDTFDPKPEAAVEVRGPFSAIATKLDGCRFTSLLPKTASIADKLVVVRSMTHTEADHDRGAHSVLTGYAPSPAIVYPSFGSVVAHELGMRNDLPPYVCVPGPNSPVGIFWCGLSKPGIGLHGTSDPETIGRARSSGCIRLANWDAIRLPTLIRPGTTVEIR